MRVVVRNVRVCEDLWKGYAKGLDAALDQVLRQRHLVKNIVLSVLYDEQNTQRVR